MLYAVNVVDLWLSLLLNFLFIAGGWSPCFQVDEGLLDEIETLQRKLGKLEEIVTEILEEREHDEKKTFERLEMKLENRYSRELRLHWWRQKRVWRECVLLW